MIENMKPQSLRYRRASDRSDELGQIFTPEPIAKLLVSELPSTCKNLLDLGAGKGALSRAATDKLSLERLVLIERDPHYAICLKKHFKQNANVLHSNALDGEWESLWKEENKNIGVISNPPYGMLALNEEQLSRLASSKLLPPAHGNWVRGDAAFLARAWDLTKKGASFAFIVTAPIVTSHEYRQLRKVLVTELQNLTITQLEERTFPGAEVRAFLVNGTRGHSRRRNVLIRKADISGNIVDEMTIDHLAALVRLDIEFYRACERLGLPNKPTMKTLADVGTHIVRGSRSRNEFEKQGVGAFHTTDFARKGEQIELSEAADNYRCATKGDILIPRVGSRCLTRHAMVVQGEGPYTDCVFRLRSSESVRERIWKTISSDFGCEWREAHASGNCARHLTQATLLAMPLL